MKTMVIKGTEWDRAPNGNSSKLLRFEGEQRKQCCVGIYGTTICNTEDEYILDRGDSSDVDFLDVMIMESSLESKAIAINDDPRTSDDEKIEKLRPIFKELGVSIRWLPNA